MKAAYIEKFGGPEVINYGDLPDPSPGPGQIVVDRCRQRQRRGLEGARRRLRQAGEVSIGPGARFLRRGQRARRRGQDLRVGDEVFGVLEVGREGAYAEKIAIGAAIVAKKPSRDVACRRRGARPHRPHRPVRD